MPATRATQTTAEERDVERGEVRDVERGEVRDVERGEVRDVERGEVRGAGFFFVFATRRRLGLGFALVLDGGFNAMNADLSQTTPQLKSNRNIGPPGVALSRNRLCSCNAVGA